jgi:hypothetical protein
LKHQCRLVRKRNKYIRQKSGEVGMVAVGVCVTSEVRSLFERPDRRLRKNEVTNNFRQIEKLRSLPERLSNYSDEISRFP